MPHSVESIKRDIAALGEKTRIFDGISLSYEQQTHERGKPKEYLELALELFKAINGKTIVEIGCMRQPLTHPITEMHPECCNDGHSTYFWATSGANVYSVDIEKKAVKIAKKSCKKFKNCRVMKRDGIKFLHSFKHPIDLLFLDAWDVMPGTDYAEKHLLAYLTAKPRLNKTNIISIDDTDVGGGGKGRLLLPVLKADNYEILIQGRQTIAFMASS
ncbi:MAG: methyltransferase domain-containing protein [Thermodesulfobacteriota bacterium]|nr:methyltransferase domain-containing protein [Thermodesulfobacteriota bacterium]